MQFNVGQLLREPIGTTSKYNLDEAVDPLEDGTREAVRGWVRLDAHRQGDLGARRGWRQAPLASAAGAWTATARE